MGGVGSVLVWVVLMAYLRGWSASVGCMGDMGDVLGTVAV